MEENVLQQRPRPVVIVTRKGMYAITAMIAIIGVVCVTALSYSFTDTGKVKISFRPIEEFGFKLKRGRSRRPGMTLPITPRAGRRPIGTLVPAAGAPGEERLSSATVPSELEELCNNNTIVGIDADKAVIRGNSIVGSILNGSIIEIVNGTVFVNGIRLNCSWFLVNVTVEFPSTLLNGTGFTPVLLPSSRKTRAVMRKVPLTSGATSKKKGHKAVPAAATRKVTGKEFLVNSATVVPLATTTRANASLPTVRDTKVLEQKAAPVVMSASVLANGSMLETNSSDDDSAFRTSTRLSLID